MITSLVALAVALSSDNPTPVGMVDVRPLTSTILVLHYRDGYVIHHKIGEPRSHESVVLDHPLDTSKAQNPSLYHLTADGSNPISPTKVARKSKGTDFAWIVESWVNNHAVNTQPDYASEHWLYLNLPKPLVPGRHYQLTGQGLFPTQSITLDNFGGLSDAIHVNLLGYRPDAPQKFAYLYAWQGDGGSLDANAFANAKFSLINSATGKVAYSGRVQTRKPKTNPETGVASQTPHQNFLGADVAECDFSAFQKPGSYFVEIDGVGHSTTFKIDPDVYRLAFKTTMQGILGNRSGIRLSPPSVPYTRPAPHNPLLTPGFAGKLVYTTSRNIDRKDPDGSPIDKPAVESGIKGPLTVSGWYQDAGDWDSYPSHIAIPQQLMLAYILAPSNFAPRELNLPDKQTKLPDILVESRWLPSFCYRLRHELISKHFGTGGLGLRICGDHFGSDTGPNETGRGSWQDTDRTWTAAGEDPVSTFGYSALAANFALCLKLAHQPDPEGINWAQEAISSFEWAEENTHRGDEHKPDYEENRIYALTCLSLLNSSPKINQLLISACAAIQEDSPLWWNKLAGPAIYAAYPAGFKDPVLIDRLTKAILYTADLELDAANRRALRWGGDWGMPMLIGQQTTPWVQALAVASVVTRTTNPARSKTYFGAVCTTADYFLGTNPLNQTWVTGLTDRFPKNVFHMDSWYVEGTPIHPGIVPYGPWAKANDEGQGPWDHDWANKSCYPKIDEWPGAERWFSNRCSPLTSEFTVWQNIAPSAFTYGFLCGARPSSTR